MLPSQWGKPGSIVEAVQNTFNGNHPCQFCEFAEIMRQNDGRKGEDPSPESHRNLKQNVKLVLAGGQMFKPSQLVVSSRLPAEMVAYRCPQLLPDGPEPPPPRRIA